MSRELKNSNDKPGSGRSASIVRSFAEAHSRFQALAVESVGRAVEIQSQFAGKAYETYMSEISNLGRMFFVGYRAFTAPSQALPYANLNGKESAIKQQDALAEAKVSPDPRRRTAAQSMITKRKTGIVGKSHSRSKRSSKPKRKAGSVSLSKG